jgi:hypothetical protein
VTGKITWYFRPCGHLERNDIRPDTPCPDCKSSLEDQEELALMAALRKVSSDRRASLGEAREGALVETKPKEM